MFDRVLNRSLILDLKKALEEVYMNYIAKITVACRNSLATVLVTFKGRLVSSFGKIDLMLFPYYFIAILEVFSCTCYGYTSYDLNHGDAKPLRKSIPISLFPDIKESGSKIVT